MSSRKFKAGFEEVDEEKVLKVLRGLPVSLWHYIHQPETRHLGPVAEDMKEMFGVGDGTHIALIDLFGVLTAAVKALDRKIVPPAARRTDMLELEMAHA